MVKTLVSNSNELNRLLEKKYGERIFTDPLAALSGAVNGIFDHKRFSITFRGDEYLLITVAPNAKDILEELLPTLTEVMGNVEPICSYDLQSKGLEEKDAMPTIEWEIKDPDKRLKEIINGRAFPDKPEILNLKLYGDKKIEDYQESEEEKQERIKNARIYGLDPGSIANTEDIEKLSEFELFLQIEALGGHIWRCRHDMYHGRIPEIDLTEEQYALEYMVYQTRKFGVEFPEPAIDVHVSRTPSYDAWYTFYHKHYKSMSDAFWQAFVIAQKEGKDLLQFMPSGNWKDLLDTPEQEKVKKK